MTKVHAIFENGVFRPTKPVNVDNGTHVELSFENVSEFPLRPTIVTHSDGFPVVISPPGTRPITSEDVANALDDE